MIVVFTDGDKTNIHLDNLELISRKENLQINRLKCSSYPKEVQPSVRLMGKVAARTYELKKPE